MVLECKVQEVGGSIPGLTVTVSEISYLLLSSRNMAKILLKGRNPQYTEQP